MRIQFVIIAAITIARPLLGAQGLGWTDCLSEVRQNNFDLRSAQLALKAARASAASSYSTFLPQVSANATYGQDNVTGQSYGTNLSASENLFNGFQDQAKVKLSLANVKLSESSLRTVQAKALADLKNAYAAVVYAQRSVQRSNDILRRRKENLRMVELRFDGGRENLGSVLLSRAYLEQVNLDTLQAQDNLENSRATLARVLGRSEQDPDWTVLGDVPTSLPPSIRPDYQALALGTPDHLQALAQVEVAESNLKVSESGFYPTLSLNGSVGKTAPTWYPDNDRWNVGATLSIPLFSGGKDYFSTRSSIAALEAASFNRGSADQTVLTKLKSAHTGWVEAIQKLKVDMSFQTAALKRSEIARGKYNNGLMTFDDWDVIENDLITRQKTAVQSQRDLVTAEALWQQTTGQGVLE